jgi:hypothetical protein
MIFGVNVLGMRTLRIAFWLLAIVTGRILALAVMGIGLLLFGIVCSQLVSVVIGPNQRTIAGVVRDY